MATVQSAKPEFTKFKLPPAGFDPRTAPDEELLRHGFPPRPADARHRARFERVLKRIHGKQIIKPELEFHPDRFHYPRQRKSVAGTEVDINWSGGVVYAPAGDSFQWVQGEWVIPNVSAPTPGGSFYAASWVGIDGDGSDDVCQAGVECDISAGSVSIYPWIEWYPYAETAITNLSVSAGDTVSVLICTGGVGSTTATVYFSDLTSGQSTSLTLTAPAGTTLVGNCAEWVVEAPTVGGQQSAFADYGEVVFTSADSETVGGVAVDGGTGDNINAVDSGGNVVSEGVLLAPTAVQVEYV
jgi:hypothetical protein